MAAALIGCASACSAVGRGAARLPRNSEVEITQLSPSSPLCAYGCQAGTGGACGTWPWLRQAVLALQSKLIAIVTEAWWLLGSHLQKLLKKNISLSGNKYNKDPCPVVYETSNFFFPNGVVLWITSIQTSAFCSKRK